MSKEQALREIAFELSYVGDMLKALVDQQAQANLLTGMLVELANESAVRQEQMAKTSKALELNLMDPYDAYDD